MRKQQLSPQIFWGSSFSYLYNACPTQLNFQGCHPCRQTIFQDLIPVRPRKFSSLAHSPKLLRSNPTFIYQCNLLWQRLLLLGQIFILGLGHRPNIWINNELLGPRTLQVPCERILIFPILSHLKTNEKLNFIILNYTPNYNLHLKLWISVQVNIKLNVGVQSVTIVII